MARKSGVFSFTVDSNEEGMRLDAFLACRLDGYSRSETTRWVKCGNVRVNRTHQKPGYRVRTGDLIVCETSEPDPVSFQPEPIDLNIMFQDDALIVLNKPAGLVVHPAPGHYSGTLVNGLLYHFPDFRSFGEEGRPGIVHRLDKNTSGVLLVAKTQLALNHLSHQFQSRSVEKQYLALVTGRPKMASGTIELPIGRHPVDRKKMSIHSRKPRAARTLWRVVKRFEHHTMLELDLHTGRTHQIRVHCAAMGHPVVGDEVYARRQLSRDPASMKEYVTRQLLHAWRIKVDHPISGVRVTFEAPLPDDFTRVLDVLKNKAAG